MSVIACASGNLKIRLKNGITHHEVYTNYNIMSRTPNREKRLIATYQSSLRLNKRST